MYKFLAYSSLLGCLWAVMACQSSTTLQAHQPPAFVEVPKNHQDTLFIVKPPNPTNSTAHLSKGGNKTNKPILLITGDSMGDGLYLAFLKKAKKNQNYVVKYAPWYGSSTAWWGKSDTLAKIIQFHQPTFLVFTLGTNELFVPNIKNRQVFIDKIITQMDTAKYIWIGPPNWKEDTGINAMIAQSVGKGRFFESKDMKFDRRKDGAHPTFKASEYWADSIENWLQTQAICPKFLKR
jgi:hypothetical protein